MVVLVQWTGESIHLDVICIVTAYKSMLGLLLQGSNIDLLVGSVG